MQLLRSINGKYTIYFFGIPINFIFLLFFLSKTELRGEGNIAYVYSLHITPFFSFSITIPAGDKTPTIPTPVTPLVRI